MFSYQSLWCGFLGPNNICPQKGHLLRVTTLIFNSISFLQCKHFVTIGRLDTFNSPIWSWTFETGRSAAWFVDRAIGSALSPLSGTDRFELSISLCLTDDDQAVRFNKVTCLSTCTQICALAADRPYPTSTPSVTCEGLSSIGAMASLQTLGCRYLSVNHSLFWQPAFVGCKPLGDQINWC